jgi:hypothetical protein
VSSTGLRYRSCDDIRAIDNDQWEAWILTDTVPWAAFPAERNCQRLTRYLLRLAVRRIIRQGH